MPDTRNDSKNSSNGGPWSPTLLVRRALRDLTDIATSMFDRHGDPREIEQALARQCGLWREYGAPLPDETPLTIIRQLPGFADWHYLNGIDPDSLADDIETPSTIECERHRRAYVLADWLQRHAGSDIAERVVKAAMRVALADLEEEMAA